MILMREGSTSGPPGSCGGPPGTIEDFVNLDRAGLLVWFQTLRLSSGELADAVGLWESNPQLNGFTLCQLADDEDWMAERQDLREKMIKTIGTLREGATYILPAVLEQCGVPPAQRFHFFDQHHSTGIDQDTSVRIYFSKDLQFRDSLDSNGLNRDEIAAVNMYTLENFSATADANPAVNVYWPMNWALRVGADEDDQSAGPDDIRPWWSYIVLLQLALLKIPATRVIGKLYRGVKFPWPESYLDDRRKDAVDAMPNIWWPFTSTSTDEKVAREFLAGGSKQVLFCVDGEGSQARDICKYSDFPEEAELLMPCGSAFAVHDAQLEMQEENRLINVAYQQTEDMVLLQRKEDVRNVSDILNQRHPALAALATTLDAKGADIASTCQRYEFNQPLPAGLLPIIFSRCAQLCGKETSFFRHDMETVVSTQDTQVEVRIGQTGASCIVLTARCLGGGGYEALCRAMQPFSAQLDAEIAERWCGCSPQVTWISLACESDKATVDTGDQRVEEGVPPAQWESDLEPEPES